MSPSYSPLQLSKYFRDSHSTKILRGTSGTHLRTNNFGSDDPSILHAISFCSEPTICLAVFPHPPLPTFRADLAVLSTAMDWLYSEGKHGTTTEIPMRQESRRHQLQGTETSQPNKTLTDALLSMGWPILHFMTRTEAAGLGSSHWIFGEGGC